MGVILDTSVLIAAERRQLRFEALLDSMGDEPVGIAAITASELLHGAMRAGDPGMWARRAAFVEALLALLPVIPFGLTEARRHADLWRELARRGRLIGAHDLLIAASALAQGAALATLNRSELSRVPGLRLVNLARFLS